MKNKNTARGRALAFIVFAVLGVASGAHGVSKAAEPSLEPPLSRETGFRSGSGNDFDSFELYYRQSSPWLDRHVADPWLPEAFRARLDLTVGRWRGSDGDSAFLAFGPAFEAFPVRDLRLSLGIQPTLLSDYEAGDRDLGGPFQLTSHASLAWAPQRALVLGIRFQHTSNARLYSSNPGADIVSIGVGYGF